MVPAIVQDAQTGKVLMLGYMNQAAVDKTNALGKVTFFSRSKQRLWTKGESSGNYLQLSSMAVDCDRDALLIKANPQGPTCHTGADTCWNERNIADHFFRHLEKTVRDSSDRSTAVANVIKMLAENNDKANRSEVTQKKAVEQGVTQQIGDPQLKMDAEVNNDDLLLAYAVDLIADYVQLLEARGYSLSDLKNILMQCDR